VFRPSKTPRQTLLRAGVPAEQVSVLALDRRRGGQTDPCRSLAAAVRWRRSGRRRQAPPESAGTRTCPTICPFYRSRNSIGWTASRW